MFCARLSLLTCWVLCSSPEFEESVWRWTLLSWGCISFGPLTLSWSLQAWRKSYIIFPCVAYVHAHINWIHLPVTYTTTSGSICGYFVQCKSMHFRPVFLTSPRSFKLCIFIFFFLKIGMGRVTSIVILW